MHLHFINYCAVGECVPIVLPYIGHRPAKKVMGRARTVVS